MSTRTYAGAGLGVGGGEKHGAHPVGDCRHWRNVACHAHPVMLGEPVGLGEPHSDEDEEEEEDVRTQKRRRV